jgi:exodeoxyribonuclease V alpha subunit
MEASTIHRLLKFDPQTRDFVHDQDQPLALDVIIVDECSMIDIPLAAALFRALPREARVVLVGDADQLPSVGPGLFLADLLAIRELPRVILTQLFRRESESRITEIAHHINSGIVPEIPEPDGRIKSDAYLLEISELSAGPQLIERLVIEQIPKKFGFQPAEITVLTPMNQGELGVVNLNRVLQNAIVPLSSGFPKVQVGELEFRLGDRVCQRVNNYNIVPGGVFNGDQGQVVGIDAENHTLSVRFWDGREVAYKNDDLYQLDLAYALTIHRSQGSEVPVVILALHDSHLILLERQLVYTAVTRAKRLLVVVGTHRALMSSVKRTRSKRRHTALVERVEELLEQGETH